MQDIIKKYLQEFPDYPKRTLAKKIIEENPELGNIEKVRCAIKYYMGAAGEKNKILIKDKSMIQEKSTISEGLRKLKIITKAEQMKNVILSEGRYLILSDVHIPYHDEESLSTALQWGLDNNIDTIILNGDIMDCYPVSSFIKDVAMPTLREEIEMTVAFFAYVRDLFPTQPIYFKLGNHEERIKNFILRSAREFADVESLKIEHLLHLDEYKINLVHREIIKLGKLNVLHGHEMGESVFSPVNPARGMFLKAKSNMLFGHNHQVSHHSENNINGENTGVWSTGCLCTLSPDYRPFAYTKWSHGFACVDVNQDDTFHVNNMRIINGKIV
jgi:predicted phosphodiesterase